MLIYTFKSAQPILIVSFIVLPGETRHPACREVALWPGAYVAANAQSVTGVSHGSGVLAREAESAGDGVATLRGLQAGASPAATIERLHRHPFTTTLKHAILTIKDIRITWITATSASVDVHWMATGHQTPAEQPLPARNGLMNLIVVQEEEQWLIAIGHSFDFTATYRRSDFGQS